VPGLPVWPFLQNNFFNYLNLTNMVNIIDYAIRRSKDGKSFVALQLEGDPEFVQSVETGRFYLTAKRCSITSTFNEDTAKKLVGTKLPGSIVRVQCDAYSYTVKETGEVIQLAHTYEYSPVEAKQPSTMHVNHMAASLV
jgi:hypothetical protein